MANRTRWPIVTVMSEGSAVQPASVFSRVTRNCSKAVTGDRFEITYGISGLEISSSGGAFGTGVTAVDLMLESGAKQSYDFNPAIAGAFEILCDGAKVGTFTVNPA